MVLTLGQGLGLVVGFKVVWWWEQNWWEKLAKSGGENCGVKAAGKLLLL